MLGKNTRHLGRQRPVVLLIACTKSYSRRWNSWYIPQTVELRTYQITFKRHFCLPVTYGKWKGQSGFNAVKNGIFSLVTRDGRPLKTQAGVVKINVVIDLVVENIDVSCPVV